MAMLWLSFEDCVGVGHLKRGRRENVCKGTEARESFPCLVNCKSLAAGECDEEVRFNRSGLRYKVQYKSGRALIAI